MILTPRVSHKSRFVTYGDCKIRPKVLKMKEIALRVENEKEAIRNGTVEMENTP
jgi:hypothetical protein